ncbi:Protein tyrosine phosphatase [Desulfarculales bacterium]
MKKLVILVAMAFALSCTPFAFAAETAAPTDKPAMEKETKKAKKAKKTAKKAKKPAEAK